MLTQMMMWHRVLGSLVWLRPFEVSLVWLGPFEARLPLVIQFYWMTKGSQPWENQGRGLQAEEQQVEGFEARANLANLGKRNKRLTWNEFWWSLPAGEEFGQLSKGQIWQNLLTYGLEIGFHFKRSENQIWPPCLYCLSWDSASVGITQPGLHKTTAVWALMLLQGVNTLSRGQVTQPPTLIFAYYSLATVIWDHIVEPLQNSWLIY